TFRLFGYNAPATFMQSAPLSTPTGPSVQWTLENTVFTDPGRTTLLLDGRYPDLAVGSQLMVVVPVRTGKIIDETGGGAIGDELGIDAIGGDLKAFARLAIIVDSIGVQTLLARITQVDQAGAARGPMSDTVTRLTLDISLPAVSDIRSVRIFELVGDALRF